MEYQLPGLRVLHQICDDAFILLLHMQGLVKEYLRLIEALHCLLVLDFNQVLFIADFLEIVALLNHLLQFFLSMSMQFAVLVL